MEVKELDKFLDAAVKAGCIMDFRTYGDTISWFAYDTLVAKSWARRILKMINDCQYAGLSPREIADLFPSMSILRGITIFDLWMIKYADISRQERENIFNFYSSLLTSRCLEDPYAYSKNIIHTEEEVSQLLKNVKQATPEIAKKLGRLVSACYHLSHAMYSDMNCSLAYDNYGPYYASKKYGKGRIVAIKEFGNLRSKELWPESDSLPCDFISITYVYKDIKMTVDTCSHAVYMGDLIKNLEHFNIKVDGKEYPVEKLDQLSEIIGKLASDIFQKFSALNLEDKKEKYYFTKAYICKKIYDKLGQDWRPSKEILSEAKGKKLYSIDWPEDREKQKELDRKMIDPRVDFTI